MALCMGDNRVGDTSDLLDLPQEVGLGRRGSFWRLRLDSSLWFVIVAHPNFVCWAGAAPQAGRRLLGWHKIGRSGRYGRLRAPSKRFSASHMKYILRLVNFSWAPSRKLAPASIFVFVGIAQATRFSGFLLPGLTNDDEPISWYFGGFLTDLKVLSAALMKNGL